MKSRSVSDSHTDSQ